MTKETRQAKVTWMRQMATILGVMLESNPISEEAIKAGVDNPFFTDTCNFSSLRHSIFELRQTLQNMAFYSEIILTKE